MNISAFEILKNDAKLKALVYFADPDFALSEFPVLIRKFNSDISDIKNLLAQHGLSVK
ncbi:MAG: hypothetical protein K5756_07060 [Clostridiales bacterium]|nr:hypothetical protein [Clostridiales bacterium]